jgi:hypothetical protein
MGTLMLKKDVGNGQKQFEIQHITIIIFKNNLALEL